MTETLTIRGYGMGVYHFNCHTDPFTMVVQFILHGQLNEYQCPPDRIQEVDSSDLPSTVIWILSPRVIIFSVLCTSGFV